VDHALVVAIAMKGFWRQQAQAMCPPNTQTRALLLKEVRQVPSLEVQQAPLLKVEWERQLQDVTGQQSKQPAREQAQKRDAFAEPWVLDLQRIQEPWVPAGHCVS